MRSRCVLLLLALASGFSAVACNGATRACSNAGLCVDCTAVCEKMVACRVGFEGGLSLGAQDEQTRCERGCATTDTITAERARCIEAVDATNVNRCHREVVGCLGVDAGNIYAE